MSLNSLKTCRVILLFLTFFASVQGLAQGEWTLFGVRPLAMGNAFVAVADDFNALYYNPAGLARIKEWQMEIVNPKFDISTNTYFLAKRIKSKGKMETSDLIDTMKDEAGKPNHIGFGLTPYFITKGWGFGLGMDNFVSFLTHNGDVEVETDAAAKVLIPISIAKNYLSNRLSIGFTIKPTAIVAFDQDISMDTISLISKDSNNQNNQKFSDFLISGLGVGLDLGMLFTPTTEGIEPTFGMSISDFGGTRLRKLLSDGTKARTVQPSVNTGISFKPVKTDNHYLLVAIDAHSINQNTHFSHKMGYGLEYGVGSRLKLEAGLYHGYPTAGLQLDLTILKIRLATYAEDRSALVGMQKNLADRRVVLQLKLLI